MIDIPRGLLVTGLSIVLGSVLLTLLLHLISLPPKLAGVAVIIYAAAGGGCDFRVRCQAPGRVPRPLDASLKGAGPLPI